VLANLLTNAFKFTYQGKVALRVRYAAPERRVVPGEGSRFTVTLPVEHRAFGRSRRVAPPDPA